jgi:hypothetical protein
LANAFSLQEGNVTFLTNHVENKVLDNGDSFTGEMDAVTGTWSMESGQARTICLLMKAHS